MPKKDLVVQTEEFLRMGEFDHRNRIKRLIASDPDALLEIILETQPFLAQRLATESDHQIAKNLMLEAKDPWDKLISFQKEAAISEDHARFRKMERLLKIYDPNRWKMKDDKGKKETSYVIIGAILFVIVILVLVFTSDWFNDLIDGIRDFLEKILEELERIR